MQAKTTKLDLTMISFVTRCNLVIVIITIHIGWTLSNQCGVKNSISPDLMGKIIGGQQADPGEYPWQVSLQYTGFFTSSHFCGGALINASWILTAAHCVATYAPSEFVVVAGKNDLTKFEQHQQTRRLAEIILHENFNRASGLNDIALLKVSEPFTLGTFINLVCLPYEHQIASGMATVTGWGSASEDGDLLDVLMEVDVPILTDTECRAEYSRREIVDTEICAGYSEGKEDSCQGDSGGPLIVKRTSPESYYIAGIVSWGEGCGRPNKAGIYTEVSHFIKWIQRKIEINS